MREVVAAFLTRLTETPDYHLVNLFKNFSCLKEANIKLDWPIYNIGAPAKVKCEWPLWLILGGEVPHVPNSSRLSIYESVMPNKPLCLGYFGYSSENFIESANVPSLPARPLIKSIQTAYKNSNVDFSSHFLP